MDEVNQLKDKLKGLFGKKQAKGAFKGQGHKLGSAPTSAGATQDRPAPQATHLPRLVVPPPSAPAQQRSPAQQQAPQAQQQQAAPPAGHPQYQVQPQQAAQQPVPTQLRPPLPAQTPQAEHPPAPEALSTAVAQLASDPGAATSADVLYRLLRNIVASPGEPKFRRVRLSNPKIQSAVVDASGGVELLLACGFEIVFEEAAPAMQAAAGAGEQGSSAAGAGQEKEDGATEGYAVLADGADLLPLQQALRLLAPLLPAPVPSSSSATSAAPLPAASSSSTAAAAAASTAALQQQAQQRRQQALREREWVPARERNTQVLLPTSVERDVPEWFFQRTGQEIKAAFVAAVRRRENDQVLMTKAMRERLQRGSGPAGPPPTYATVKVRFPEGISLQGEFGAGEPVAAVFGWVADCLSDPLHTYELVLPSRHPLEVRAQSVREAELLPSVALLFRWTGQSAADMAHMPALRQELLRDAKPATASY